MGKLPNKETFRKLVAGIRVAASRNELDPDKYEAVARAFYAKCPHIEAVYGYMLEEMSNEMSRKAPRSPMGRLIDKAVSK